MPKMTPAQEAAYALDYGVARSDLGMAAQLEYDRLLADRQANGQAPDLPAWPASQVQARTSPEVRAEILRLVKEANPKYARPFEKGRVSHVSFVGTESWADYGQVVLQLAILDTLLSVEEHLAALREHLTTSASD